MNVLDPIALGAMAALALLLVLLAVRRRSGAPRGRASPRAAPRDSLDTVAAWPPEASRVLSMHERKAFELLRRALPGFIVLAQVPLSRFLRVPTRHSYTDWMQRAGSLSADLLICDQGSRVVAVVDIRAATESERSRRRHDRLGRVLKAAGIRVYTWREDDLPSLSNLRSSLANDLAPPQPSVARPATSQPMPLIPVPEIEEVLAAGDHLFQDTGHEPVPSAFLDEMESERGQLSKA